MAKKEEVISADALNDTLKQIQKLFGKGAVMRLGEREAVDVDAIPSGSLLLDEALGVGGYPKMVEERHLLMLNTLLILSMLKT